MSSDRLHDRIKAQLEYETILKREREARLKERIHGINERIENTKVSTQTKTGELVIEALVFTYLGLGALTLLINLVFFGGAQWVPILVLALGGAVVVGLFGYALNVWVRAFRNSRSKRG